MSMFPLMMRLRLKLEPIARVLPTATLPLASLTMLFTALEGWRMVMTFAVLMAASYSYKMLTVPAVKLADPAVVVRRTTSKAAPRAT